MYVSICSSCCSMPLVGSFEWWCWFLAVWLGSYKDLQQGYLLTPPLKLNLGMSIHTNTVALPNNTFLVIFRPPPHSLHWYFFLFNLWGPEPKFTCSFSMNSALVNQYYSVGSGCPRGVMVKALDCGIVVSKFELQSCYYIHFRTNTLEKGMNVLILPAMG